MLIRLKPLRNKLFTTAFFRCLSSNKSNIQAIASNIVSNNRSSLPILQMELKKRLLGNLYDSGGHVKDKVDLKSPELNESGMVIAIALIEVVRTGLQLPMDLLELLKELSLFHNANENDESRLRDRYYAAAALAWLKGDFLRAGALHESLLVRGIPDPLSLRLATDAYILSGNAQNALRCIIRNPVVFHIGGVHRASVLGLLSSGYGSLGRWSDAEEAAKRALSMSSEPNSYAITALIDCLVSNGKSSEVNSLIENEPMDYSGQGQFNVWCAQGSAYITRGNCNSAYRLLQKIYDPDVEPARNILSIMQDQRADDAFVDGELTIPTLLRSSLLLWQVVLNLVDKHELPLDEVSDAILSASSKLSPSVTVSLIRIIASAVKVIAVDSMNHSALLELKQQKRQQQQQTANESGNKSFSFSSWMTSSKSTKTVSKIDVSNSHDTVTEDSLSLVTRLRHEYMNDLSRYSVELDTMKDKEALLRHTLDTSFLHLQSIQHDLPFISQNSSEEKRDGVSRQRQSDTLQIIGKAFVDFASNNFSSCASKLMPFYHMSYTDTGLHATNRDTLHQMLIESLIRSDQFSVAKLLLNERTVLFPNDGQTWRRLSVVHQRLGEDKQASEANYTAWQLGIGQGGFGGPI